MMQEQIGRCARRAPSDVTPIDAKPVLVRQDLPPGRPPNCTTKILLRSGNTPQAPGAHGTLHQAHALLRQPHRQYAKAMPLPVPADER